MTYANISIRFYLKKEAVYLADIAPPDKTVEWWGRVSSDDITLINAEIFG